MAVFSGRIASEVLGMEVGLKVILPHDVHKDDLKVLYLLHGLQGGCESWTRWTSIERYANEKGFIVIMPEVHRSFYMDMKHGLPYFTYITKELPDLCKRMFQIPIEREKTFIAGLSMGGYGAMKAALSCPENYYAVAAFSSLCDIKTRLNGIEDLVKYNEIKGIMGDEKVVEDKEDLFTLASQLNTEEKSSKPKWFMTCGTEDFLYEQNIRLKNHIERLDFEYIYEEWEGAHTWAFWDLSIQKALEWFITLS